MKKRECKKIILLFMVLVVSVLCIPSKQVLANDVLINTPEPLVWGQSYSGEFSRAGEVAIYTFNLAESGHIGMVWNVEENPVFIKVYDSAQNSVCEVLVSKGMTNQAFELLKGEYTMEVTYSFHGFHCQFSFTPTFTASGETKSESYDEKNNEIGLATSYKVGDSYTGHLADNDTIDIYKMRVKSTGNLAVSVDSKFKSYSIKLVNDYGDISYKETVTSGKHKYSFFVPKGTYYGQFLGEKNSTGVYSFRTSLSAIPKGKLTSVKNVKTCSLQVKWGKSSKVTGYQLQISTNKKFSKAKKSFYITDNTTSSVKLYNLKKRKTYYLRVRNYITAPNGKSYYSKWSGNKKVSVRM